MHADLYLPDRLADVCRRLDIEKPSLIEAGAAPGAGAEPGVVEPAGELQAERRRLEEESPTPRRDVHQGHPAFSKRSAHVLGRASRVPQVLEDVVADDRIKAVRGDLLGRVRELAFDRRDVAALLEVGCDGQVYQGGCGDLREPRSDPIGVETAAEVTDRLSLEAVDFASSSRRFTERLSRELSPLPMESAGRSDIG